TRLSATDLRELECVDRREVREVLRLLGTASVCALDLKRRREESLQRGAILVCEEREKFVYQLRSGSCRVGEPGCRLVGGGFGGGAGSKHQGQRQQPHRQYKPWRAEEREAETKRRFASDRALAGHSRHLSLSVVTGRRSPSSRDLPPVNGSPARPHRRGVGGRRPHGTVFGEGRASVKSISTSLIPPSVVTSIS